MLACQQPQPPLTSTTPAGQVGLSLSTHSIFVTFYTRRSPEVLGAFQTNLLPLEAARAQGRHHGVCLSTFGFGFAMNSVRARHALCHTLRHVTLRPRRCC